MGRLLTRTVVVDDVNGPVALLAGTEVPARYREQVSNPLAFEAIAEPVAEGELVLDEDGEFVDTLDKLTKAQLDKLGMQQNPPIPLDNVKNKADKIDVLRMAGIGVVEAPPADE